MISFLIAIVGIIILLFGFVLLFGAPYLPTLGRQEEVAFELLNLKPGQMLLELGCGDGRMLVAAARRGLKATGYELNPLLALIARARIWRYRRDVKVVCGNFWRTQWPQADGVFVFLLDRFMPRLDSKLQMLPHKPIRLVSLAFKIPGRQPDKELEGLYLYEY